MNVTMEEDKEKTIYPIQIQHLDRQLESLQLRCDGLQQQNQDLVSGCGALVTDQTDICEFLQRLLQPDRLQEDQLQRLQEDRLQAAEREHQDLDLLQGRGLQELQDRVQQLEDEAVTRAALFEEQQEEQEQQEQRLLLLTKQQSGVQRGEEALLRQQEALQSALSLYTEAGASLTLTQFQDQIQAEVQVLVLEERAQQGRRLEAFQTLLAQNEALWTEKTALKEQQVALLQQGGGLKEDLQGLRHKNYTRSTELENLRRRSLKLREALNDCSSAHEPLLEEEEALRRLLTAASKERRQKALEADRLRAELQGERGGSRRLEAGVQEAVGVLEHILTDSEKTFRTQGERLLEILQSSAPQGPGSTPKESSDPQGPGSTPKEISDPHGPGSTPKEISDPHGPGSTREESSAPQGPGSTPKEISDPQGPGSTREESSAPQGPGSTPKESSDPQTDRTQTLATDPWFLMARYRPGDLGFIPRPTWTRKAAASRQKLCRQKRSGSDPKACTAADC